VQSCALTNEPLKRKMNTNEALSEEQMNCLRVLCFIFMLMSQLIKYALKLN